MRYGTTADWCLLWAGVGLSVVAGCISPLGSVVFRGITNTLLRGQAEYDQGGIDFNTFAPDVIFFVEMYLALGLTTFVFSYLSVSFFFVRCFEKRCPD